jgi:hypothetical protein
MAEYLKQKIAPSTKSNAEDFLERERAYTQQLKELAASKPEMVNDFQHAVAKDLPVEKINTLGQVQPITSGADFAAKQAARKQAVQTVASASDVLDYNQLRKEFTDKAKMAARSPIARKALSILPFAGAGVAALSGDPAMAAEELAQDAAGPVGLAYEAIKASPTGPATGSLDSRIENGTLTPQDKILLRQQALQKIGK